FNEAGQMLAGDDDDNDGCTVITALGSLDSCVTLNLTPGIYFVAVGTNNVGAFESEALYLGGGGNDFADNDSGILTPPSTEIAVLVGRETGPDPTQEEGPYVINFSMALAAAPGSSPSVDAEPVPALPLVYLLILAATVGGLARRRLSGRAR
ncbi:MAG: hypothetical protein AAGL17_16215, partial [Cyanobacteria bacterium J06576_12]